MSQQVILNDVSGQCYFAIEGNIGCGKSTFLTLLKQRLPECQLIEEPVSEWQNLNGKNINMLDRYYKLPTRWGFTFQTLAIHTRVKALREAQEQFPNRVKISERSILSDKYIFSQLMKDLNYMNEAEFTVFCSLYENYQKMASESKTKIIYLKCTPQKCQERTKIRKRAEEQEIPMEYLERIHEKHEQWLMKKESRDVLVLDTTEDFYGNQARVQEMFSQLKSFIDCGM